MADVVIAALHQRKEGFLNTDVTVLLGRQRRSEDKQSPEVARGGGRMCKSVCVSPPLTHTLLPIVRLVAHILSSSFSMNLQLSDLFPPRCCNLNIYLDDTELFYNTANNNPTAQRGLVELSKH